MKYIEQKRIIHVNIKPCFNNIFLILVIHAFSFLYCGCQFTLNDDPQNDLSTMLNTDSELNDGDQNLVVLAGNDSSDVSMIDVYANDASMNDASMNDASMNDASMDDGVNDHNVGGEENPHDGGMIGGDEAEIEPEEQLRISLDLPPRACQGAWMCAQGKGCVAGECGVCNQTSDCDRGDVCRDAPMGECGACDESNPCPTTQNCIEGICLPAQMSVVSLSLSSNHRQRLFESRYEEDEWIPCELQVGSMNEPNELPQFLDEYDQSCRIKVHGGSSRDLRKLSFRVHLGDVSDDILESLAWGDDQMLLRAEYNDPTVIRNVLSHLMFSRFTHLPHSRWRYLWVLINGESYGLYLQVERHRDAMMTRWLRNPQAPRYESDPPRDLFSQGAGALVTLNDRLEYWNSYELKAGVSYAPLIELIEEFIGMSSTSLWVEENKFALLASHFDWGQYLQYLAIMTFIQNQDHVRKNFLLSRQIATDQQDRWEVYPWDLDLSWGCLYNNETGLTLCDQALVWDGALDFGFLNPEEMPTYPTDGFYNLLMSRAVGPVKAQERYRELLCAFTIPIDESPDLMRIEAWRRALSSKLAPWVSADEQRAEPFEGTYQMHVDALREFWLQRASLIEDTYQCAELRGQPKSSHSN